MPKWEYHVTTNLEDLAQLGREGWELVDVAERPDGLVHYLRRPLPSLAEQITLEQRERVKRVSEREQQPAPAGRRGRILNPDLLALIARAGHTDSITICDRGFPVPVGPERVDLSLVDDVPTVPQVLAALRAEAAIDRIFMAEEAAEISPDRLAAMRTGFSDLRLDLIPHLSLKRLSQGAKGTVRTGDTCHYANVIVVFG